MGLNDGCSLAVCLTRSALSSGDLDKAGKLRKSLFQIPGIERRYIQPVGFGIASEQPPFAIYQPSPAWRHDPQVELVSIRQTLIATVLRHLKLIEPPRKEAGNQHHSAAKKEGAPRQ